MNTSMTITLEELRKNSLTPNEYFYLYCLTENHKLNYPVDLEKLERNRFIKVTSEGVFPRIKAYNLFKEAKEAGLLRSNDDLEADWNKLLAEYPKKVGRRRLQDKARSKPIFMKLLKKYDIDTILEGLRNENKARDTAAKKNEFFDAPKGLSAWLFQEAFLTYLDEDSDEDDLAAVEKTESL